jgi:hypothetical protein
MSNILKTLVKTFFIILFFLSSNAIAAEEKVGVVGAANLNVTATSADNEKRDVILGDDIYFKDTITADDTGNAQLLFIDKSALTVGSNSTVTIDEFVYNPATSSGNMVMRGTKGTFRFIGGALSKKNPVKIKTPVGTIGIRGGIAIVDINPVSGATNATFVYGDMMTFQNVAGDIQTINDMGQGLAVDTPTAMPQVFQATTAQMASQMQALAGTVGTTGGAAQVPTQTDVDKGIEAGPEGDLLDPNRGPDGAGHGDEHGDAGPGNRGNRFADREPGRTPDGRPMQPGDGGGHMTPEGGYVDGEGNYHTPEEVAQHMAENPEGGPGGPGGYYEGRGPGQPGAPAGDGGFFGFFGGDENEGGREPEGGFFGRFFGPDGEEQEHGMKPGGDGGQDTPDGGYIDPEGNYHSPQEVAEYRAERVPGGQYYDGGGAYYGGDGGYYGDGGQYGDPGDYPGGPNDSGYMTSDGGYVDGEGKYHNAGEVEAYMVGRSGGFDPGGPNDPGQLTADGGYIDAEGNYHDAAALAAFRAGQLDGSGGGHYDPNGGGGYYDPNTGGGYYGGGEGYYDPNGGGGYYNDPNGGGGYYGGADPYHDPNGGGGYYDPYYDANGGGGYYDPYYDPNRGGGYYDPYYDPNGGGGYYDPYYDPNGGGGHYGDPVFDSATGFFYDPNGSGGYYDPATGYFYDPITGDSFYDPYFDPYADHNFDPNDPYNGVTNSPQPHNGFMAGFLLRDKFANSGPAKDVRYWNRYANEFVFTKGGAENRTTGAQISLENITGGNHDLGSTNNLHVRFGNSAYSNDPGYRGSFGIEDDDYLLEHAGITYGSNNTTGQIEGELVSDSYNTINAQLPCSRCEFVHWGVWASTIDNTTGGGGIEVDVAEMIPYVAGELTNMPGVQDINAIYTGDVFGTTSDGSILRTMTGTFNSNINIVNGIGTLNSFNATVNDGVNFGGGATLSLSGGAQSLSGNGFHDIGISGGGFSGTINGALFGPQAEDIGGNMQFNNGTIDATGVYAGSR